MHLIDGKSYDMSFRNISLMNELIRIGEHHSAMLLMKCDSYDELQSIIDRCSVKRWTTVSSKLHDYYKSIGLTLDEIKSIEQSEVTFDYNKDFDAYYYDFFKLGIDLYRDDISIFTFNTLLSGIIEDDTSMTAKRIHVRCYRSSKGESSEYKRYMCNKQEKYALSADYVKPIDDEVEGIGGGLNGKDGNS